jgi:hypothetical protein
VHTESKYVSVLFPQMCSLNLFQCNGLCLIILQMHVISNEQILHILGPWNGWQSLQRWATTQQSCLCCNVDQTLSFIGVEVHTEPKNVSVLFPHMCTLSIFWCNGLCLIILQMQQGHVTRNGQILHEFWPLWEILGFCALAYFYKVPLKPNSFKPNGQWSPLSHSKFQSILLSSHISIMCL